MGPEIAAETSVTWTRTGPANALYRWFKGRPRHALFIITICSGWFVQHLHQSSTNRAVRNSLYNCNYEELIVWCRMWRYGSNFFFAGWIVETKTVIEILMKRRFPEINRGTPNSSFIMFMGFSLINHPAIGVSPWLWKAPGIVSRPWPALWSPAESWLALDISRGFPRAPGDPEIQRGHARELDSIVFDASRMGVLWDT